MKGRFLATCALAGALFLGAAGTALAETMPTPGGPDYGQHIAMMAQVGPADSSAIMGGMPFGHYIHEMAMGTSSCSMP